MSKASEKDCSWPAIQGGGSDEDDDACSVYSCCCTQAVSESCAGGAHLSAWLKQVMLCSVTWFLPHIWGHEVEAGADDGEVGVNGKWRAVKATSW